MKEILLTYIIPVFNAEKTIVDTLNSLYSVGMDEDSFEVIMVDDCSTDKTRQIIKEYMLTHSNIRLVCQTINKKQGAARNRAIPMAKGKFISFVDSDDLVESGISNALKMAQHSDVDVLICQTRSLNVDRLYTLHHLSKEETRVLSGGDFLDQHYHWHLPGAPWGYIFKTQYLQGNNIHFIEGHFHEDVDWTIQQIYFASSVCICADLIYTYVHREDSTVNQRNCTQYADTILADYRTILFAETVKKVHPIFAEQCISDRSYSIKAKMIRLWKLPDKNFFKFYRCLGNENRLQLWSICDKQILGRRVGFLLNHKWLSMFLLYFLSYPLQLIKRIA